MLPSDLVVQGAGEKHSVRARVVAPTFRSPPEIIRWINADPNALCVDDDAVLVILKFSKKFNRTRFPIGPPSDAV